ncbi:hypothetical protein MY10362_000059 [Beauveria mimosiformis]
MCGFPRMMLVLLLQGPDRVGSAGALLLDVGRYAMSLPRLYKLSFSLKGHGPLVCYLGFTDDDKAA